MTYRKLCKQVLHQTSAMAEAHFKAYQQGRLPLGLHKPAGGDGLAGASAAIAQEEPLEVPKAKKKKEKKKKRKKKQAATEGKDEL